MTSTSLPLVSVLIPAYNHEKYIQSAIRSVIAQSYPHIELLVLDDGSKDSTWANICGMKDECQARFARVWFETQPNAGTSETLNTLLHQAKGELFYLIASDDMAMPNAIETLYTFLQDQPEYLMAVGDNIFIDEHGDRVFWDRQWNNVYREEEATYLTFAQALQARLPYIDFFSDDFGSYESLLKENYIPNGYLVRTSVMLDAGGFTKEAPLEDWYMNLQVTKKGKIKFINEPLFCYRWHSSNTVKDETNKRYISVKTLYYEKQLAEKSPIPWVKKTFYSTMDSYGSYKLNLSPFFAIKKVNNPLYKEKYILFLRKKITLSKKYHLDVRSQS